MRLKNKIILLTIFISFCLNGCATTKFSPDYLDPSFSPADVDLITILPMADLRKDRSVDLGEDWENKVIKNGPGNGWSTKDLFSVKLGYNIAIEKDFGGVSSINEDDFIDAEPSWVKKLGPKDARWILLVVLEDFVSRKTFGVAFSAECSAALYDKETGKAVWQHKALGKVEGGGLVPLLLVDPQDTLQRIFFSDLIAAQFPTEHGYCVFCATKYRQK